MYARFNWFTMFMQILWCLMICTCASWNSMIIRACNIQLIFNQYAQIKNKCAFVFYNILITFIMFARAYAYNSIIHWYARLIKIKRIIFWFMYILHWYSQFNQNNAHVQTLTCLSKHIALLWNWLLQHAFNHVYQIFRLIA